jgi:hypothetical protein
MLQQTQSKSIQMVRHLLILPALAVFLMAFNTETVYTFADTSADFLTAPDGKSIALTIDKNTTDQQLMEMKEKLGKDQIDFSYTTVRNEAGEIINLSLHLAGTNSAGKKFSGSYETRDGTPIEPLLMRFDDTRNSVSFSSVKGGASDMRIQSQGGATTIWVEAEDEAGGQNAPKTFTIRTPGPDEKRVMVWNSDGDPSTNQVEIREVEGDTLIIVNKVEVGSADGEELENSGEKIKHITVTKTVKNGENQVMILRDSDDEADIEVIEGGSGSFFFLDSGKGEKPLFYIDGKKASEQEVKALKPDAIEKIEVLKGDKATEQYGKKAKDGVVLITTKK